MNLTLSNYTTAAEVRALLGITSKEFKDDQFGLRLYSQLLAVELSEIDSSLQTDYETILAKPTKSNVEQKLLDFVQVFSSYATALQVLPSLEQLAPQTITDGRAQVTRQASDLAALESGLRYGYERLRSKVISTYKDINPNVQDTSALTLPTLAAAVGLPADPVTGA